MQTTRTCLEIHAEMKALVNGRDISKGMPYSDEQKWDELYKEWQAAEAARQEPSIDTDALKASIVNTDPRAQKYLADNGKDHPVLTNGAGERIECRSGTDPFTPLNGVDENAIGESIYNLLRGDIVNSNFGTSDTAGGYLLQPEYSTKFIDLARSQSVCFKAGAQTANMRSSELVVAGLTTDPTSSWRPETVSVTSSNLVFEKTTLRAKTLACIVPVSIEFLEDASNGASLIESTIRLAMAQKLDEAGLMGSGASAEPLGLHAHSDVNAIASVGTPTDWSHPDLAVGDIEQANFSGSTPELAWVQASRDRDTYSQLQDTTNQPLQMPYRLAQVPQYHTTSIDTDEGGSSNESTGYVGHFPSMLFGMKTNGVVVRILDSGNVTDSSSDSWNATDQLMRHIVAYLRADVAILRPTFFTKMSGITA